MTQKSPSNKMDIPFEDAQHRLEEIVSKMESGELTLEELINKYEEGTKLYKICEQKLNQAEQRIEIIKNKKIDKSLSTDKDDEKNAFSNKINKNSEIGNNEELF